MPERTVPAAIEAEQALLGSMMMNASVIEDVMPIVRGAEAFAIKAHQDLYAALVDLREVDGPVDLLIVSDWLRQRGQFEEVGGQDYMVTLAESFGDWANAEHYARVVAEKHRRRELIRAAGDLLDRAYDPLSGDVADSVAKHLQRVERVLVNDVRSDDEIRAVLRRLPAEYAQRERTFIRTGLTPFDERNGGVERGCMTILAARPSVGKTALAMWLALQSVSRGVNVLFVSVEMRQAQIAMRVLANLSGTKLGVLRHRFSASELAASVESAVAILGSGRLYLREDLGNARDVYAAAKAAVRKQGVSLVIVDYLQLIMPEDQRDNRNLQVGSMARSFKRIAQANGAAMLVLSQLSREVEKCDRAPTLSDLRDSGEIEQHADVVLFLHRPKKDDRDDVELELRVAKNRQGPTGDFRLWFNKPTMTFSMGMRMEDAAYEAEETMPF